MAVRSLGAVLAFTSLAACSTAAMTLQSGTNQLTQTLTIQQVQSGGAFVGYTGTTFSEDIPSNKHVRLLSAALSSSTGEFSWVKSLVGTAEPEAGAQVLLQKTSFEGATSPTSLDIVDTGDLLPLYPTQDFRIYWVFQYANPQAQSYPNGVSLTFTYQLQIE